MAASRCSPVPGPGDHLRRRGPAPRPGPRARTSARGARRSRRSPSRRVAAVAQPVIDDDPAPTAIPPPGQLGPRPHTAAQHQQVRSRTLPSPSISRPPPRAAHLPHPRPGGRARRPPGGPGQHPRGVRVELAFHQPPPRCTSVTRPARRARPRAVSSPSTPPRAPPRCPPAASPRAARSRRGCGTPRPPAAAAVRAGRPSAGGSTGGCPSPARARRTAPGGRPPGRPAGRRGRSGSADPARSATPRAVYHPRRPARRWPRGPCREHVRQPRPVVGPAGSPPTTVTSYRPIGSPAPSSSCTKRKPAMPLPTTTTRVGCTGHSPAGRFPAAIQPDRAHLELRHPRDRVERRVGHRLAARRRRPSGKARTRCRRGCRR